VQRRNGSHIKTNGNCEKSILGPKVKITGLERQKVLKRPLRTNAGKKANKLGQKGNEEEVAAKVQSARTGKIFSAIEGKEYSKASLLVNLKGQGGLRNDINAGEGKRERI